MRDFLSWFISYEALALYGIAGCIAAAIFVPFLRRYAIITGAILLAAVGIYSKGKRDEKIRQQKLAAEEIKRGREARARAERDAADNRLHDPRDNPNL